MVVDHDSRRDVSHRPVASLALCAALLISLTAGCAQPLTRPAAGPDRQPTGTAAEDATDRYFESIRHSTPHAILFLREMPKGADLHSHLSGAVYAESYIDAAAALGHCISPSLAIVRPPCDAAAGTVPAARAAFDPVLRNRLIDAMSMRNWQSSQGSGHDQFFDSFCRFGAAMGIGDRFAEVIAPALPRIRRAGRTGN
jgi:hypothetical protein